MQKHRACLISIVIPVFNGANYMREAIDSALAQTYKNVEILVINDGSTDETREIALSYGEKIRYFEKNNGGVSTALNLGIQEMHGEYFSWLSHDDLYYPNKIEREMEALLEDGDMGKVVYSGWDHLIMPDHNLVRNEAKFMDQIPQRIKETGALMPTLGLVSGCTLLIPRKMLLEHGGFDEKYRAVQDYKLWFEMFRGRRTIYVPEHLIVMRSHEMQTGKIYAGCLDEAEWLYRWMLESFCENDLAGSSLSLYTFYCIFLMHVWGNFHAAYDLAAKRLLSTAEDKDIDARIESILKRLTDNESRDIYLYCAGRRGRRLLWQFALHGIPVAGIVDSNETKWGQVIAGFSCMRPAEIPYSASIIVTKLQPDELIQSLKKKGYQYVCSFDDFEGELGLMPFKKELFRRYMGA